MTFLYYFIILQPVNQPRRPRWSLTPCASPCSCAACPPHPTWRWLATRTSSLPGPARGTAGFIPSLHSPVLFHWSTWSNLSLPARQDLGWISLLLPGVTLLFSHRRRHVTSHRSSSFTLLQSLAIEDSRDKPTYSVLLGQLFAFIGTNPDQAVRPYFISNSNLLKNGRCLCCV